MAADDIEIPGVTAGDGIVPRAQYEFQTDERLRQAPWRVQRIEVTEQLSGEHDATLWLESDDPLTEEADLLETSASLVIRRPGFAERRFSGIVRTVVSEGVTRANRRRCRVAVAPALRCLDDTVEWRKFVGLGVPDILKEVLRSELGPFGREHEPRLTRQHSTARGSDRFPVREYTAQRGETTYQFVRRLCSEEGLAIWYDQGGPVEKLIVSDDSSQFTRWTDPVAFLPGTEVHDGHEAVVAFEVVRQRVPTVATVDRFDLTRPGVRLVERAQAESDRDEQPPATELYDPTAPVTLHDYEGDQYRDADTRHQARVRLEAAQVSREVGRGRSTLIGIQPGVVFKLDSGGGVDSPLDGEYLVVAVTHTGEAPRWGEGADVAPYANSFVCIPAHVPFRPQRIPRPTATFDYAVVAAVADDDPIHHDMHGRVKVKFWWDRAPGEPSARDSGWIPVASPWAGAGRGIQAIPRRGDVVVVSYDMGDPDRPVVTGSANTGSARLLYDLERKTAVAWRTQSQRVTDDGAFTSPHYNELVMDDAARDERFGIRAGWNFDRTVLNDDVTRIAHDETRRVGNDQAITVERNRSVDIKKDTTTHVGGNDTVAIDGDAKLTVTGGRSTEITKDDSLKVHADQGIGVAGSVRKHVEKDATTRVDGRLRIEQGGTLIECVEGSVLIKSEHSMRLEHGGASVLIDDDGNVHVSTARQVKIEGKEIQISGDIVALNASTEATLAVGDNAVKIDASGISISGKNIKETAEAMHQTTAGIILQN